MKDIVISDAVKYIGADDKDLDLFESQYIVPNGVSYNSYVILDEKIAVMDTIDTRKTDEWKENLERVLDGRTPDYLVVSHLEPDHAGSIKEFADKYPEAKIVASAKAIAMLPQFFEIADLADRAVAVKEGEELSLEAIPFSSLWLRWFTGRKLWLNTKSLRRFCSQQMDLVNSVRWMQMRTGLVKQEDTTSIS